MEQACIACDFLLQTMTDKNCVTTLVPMLNTQFKLEI